MSTPNAVIKTLADIRPERDVDPADWKHHDGSRLTPDELHLVLKSTAEDFCATSEFLWDRMAVHVRLLEIVKEMTAIKDRYADPEDPDETLGELQGVMSGQDWARLKVLALENHHLQEHADQLEAVVA